MRSTKKFWLSMGVLVIVLTISFLLINSYFSKKYENAVTSTDLKKSNEDRSVKLPEDNDIIIEPSPTPPPKYSISSQSPSKYNFVHEIIKDNKPVKGFSRGYEINFPNPDEFTEVSGVTCFRGNNYRNSASYGYADVKEQKLEKIWNIKIGYIDSWTGVGWNGQPVIIKWDESLRKKMNLYPNMKNKDNLKEIIYATLDGNIYFLDLDNGEATRPVINVGYPHKGSVSVDSRGYPLLYAGQGIDEKGGKKVEIGYRIFSLINQKLLYFINGMDPSALRAWGAFDSTGLVDRKTDTLIECGENGIFYNLKLNTQFDPDKGSISIKPDMVKYRYSMPDHPKIGTENSVAIYKNYAYFADNGGLLQCVDLNSLEPVWLRNITDDTDSTIAIEETGSSEVSLYTACEVDKQGDKGFSYIRKINALTGDLIWEKSIKCVYDSVTNGGALASPVVGKKDIENLVIYNIAKTENKRAGKLVAFDKKTGEEIWVVNLADYCWSSPVDVYTKEGKSYIVVCDSAGYMMLFEGKSGKMLDKISLGSNIEGSPAVYENMIVVGTRGQKIFGVSIK